VKKSSTFYRNPRFITMFTRYRHSHMSYACDRAHIFTPCFFKIHFDISFFSMHRYPEWLLPFMFHSLIFPVSHASERNSWFTTRNLTHKDHSTIPLSSSIPAIVFVWIEFEELISSYCHLRGKCKCICIYIYIYLFIYLFICCSWKVLSPMIVYWHQIPHASLLRHLALNYKFLWSYISIFILSGIALSHASRTQLFKILWLSWPAMRLPR
jgi:hypothetical protein